MHPESTLCAKAIKLRVVRIMSGVLTSPTLTPEKGSIYQENIKQPTNQENNPTIQEQNSNKIEVRMTTPESSGQLPSEANKALSREEKQRMKAIEQEEARMRKQEEKRMKELQKEREKLEREQKKEEERRRKEQEKLEREQKKEREKQEREMKRELERKEKEKRKEEERLEREQKKEQEKRKRQLEREEKERDRQEKKRKIMEEKERKEEDKKKAQEDRSQMKISNFFQIGATPSSQISDTGSAKEASLSVYDEMFLPFFKKNNTVLAPSGQLDHDSLTASKMYLDSITIGTEITLDNLFPSNSAVQLEKPRKHTPPIEIVNALNSSEVTESQIYSMLSHLSPIKYLHFYENAKPPYIGTWCSEEHQSITLSDPLSTANTGLDYDYDSDLEWNGEEEGEGEDIDNEDDEEEDDEEIEEDEMEDFVDSNDTKKKRTKFMGPLISINKWNDGTIDAFLDMRYHNLTKHLQFPIDPFKNYWEKESGPRKTLEEVNPQTVSPVVGETKDSKQVNTLTPHKPVITDKDTVKQLISFIELNSDFTIGTLVELCQKQFKSYTKSIIKHTVQQVASYDKKAGKWTIKTEIKNS